MFVRIPEGVTVRKLDESRRAQGQMKAFKYSAWRDGDSPVYGDTLREVINKIK